MNRRLARLQLLKSVLGSISAGRGVSASVVLSLRGGKGPEGLAARLVLLGFPPSVSMAPIVSDKSRELGMLASLVTLASNSNVASVGKKGSELSTVLERWLKADDERAMEAKILRMRGLIMSAVLGAVMATVSALGPIVASTDFLGAGVAAQGPTLLYASAAMVAVSSSMLGLFLSGRRFYLNLAVGLGVFWVAFIASSPLAAIPVVSLWGIK
jgi:hypothetical protein